LEWKKLAREKEQVDRIRKQVSEGVKVIKKYELFNRIAILCKELIERTKKHEKK